jgi:hypothetical protein
MKTLFFTKKGGHGKTTHAIGYALYSDSILYTNDCDNGTLKIYGDMFKNCKLRPFGIGEEIEVDEKDNLVFDMGGFEDNRILQIASFVDVCVVPVFYQSRADFEPFINTILELEKYNKNIVILINNTEKDYIGELESLLKEKFSYKIFVVSRSKYIRRLADENKTIFDLYKLGGLDKYMVRNLIKEIEEFYGYLQNINTKTKKIKNG